MAVIYVPRTFGGTLILTVTINTNPSNPSITTTTAYGRDGKVVASARDGRITARGR